MGFAAAFLKRSCLAATAVLPCLPSTGAAKNRGPAPARETCSAETKKSLDSADKHGHH